MRLAIGVTLAGPSCPTVETARETRHPQAGEPFFGQAARYAGNGPEYVDNGDGTVTDRATGLVRMQVGGGHLEAGPESDGRSDWRLPNAGELQGIVD